MLSDAGIANDTGQDLDLAHRRTIVRHGLRIAWNPSTMLFIDCGVSRKDRLFFVGIGQVF